MVRGTSKKAAILAVFVTAAVILSGRGTALAAGSLDASDGGTVISLLHKYDSTDTAVVRSVDQAAGTVTLCQHELGRYYTLSVDNTSMIYSRYEKPISAALLTAGEVVDATFLRQSKHLNSLVVSGAAWVKENVRDYRFDADRELLVVEGKNYHIPNTALLLGSENGVVSRILAEEILPDDVLKISGIDKEIYSVVVTSGHGYLRLTSSTVGDRDITGAWLNLENKVIRRVGEKTLMSAPEGTYKLQIIGQGANDSRQVVIERGRETLIDASTIRMEELETTEITFLVEPEGAEAEITVDGEEVYAGLPVYLTKGVHQVKATAPGYLSWSERIVVGNKAARVTIPLEEDEDASAAYTSASTASSSDTAATDSEEGEDSETDAGDASTGASDSPGEGATDEAGAGSGATTITVVDASGNETTRTTMPGYEISVETPYGAEFYLDDEYIGFIPVTFEKVTGTHTVTLREDGYETRSYNIFIDDSQKDKTYAFPAMTPIS